MDVFINFDPYTTLICFIQNNDFKKDQILEKYRLKKWPIGFETAKFPSSTKLTFFSHAH